MSSTANQVFGLSEAEAVFMGAAAAGGLLGSLPLSLSTGASSAAGLEAHPHHES